MAENVSWNEQNPSYKYEVDNDCDPTFGIADNDDADLGNFFSRPIQIQQYQWSPSIVDFYQEFNPWNIFFNNDRVQNRVENFNLLRAKLHVKILINGNGFYYGRLLANYKPLHNFDDLTLDRALISQDNIAASQRPHIYIDPTTSQGGELVLPFFYNQNAVSIPNREYGNLGTISIRTLNDLVHANGATEAITITVLAWAEDVSLAVPTSFIPQAGKEVAKSKKKKSKPRVTVTKQDKGDAAKMGDEYGSGPVSGPSATVARVAGMLVNAPFIGPYAKAAQIAASGVSNIAKLFGYSRPATLDAVAERNLKPFANIVSTNLADNIQKLSLDSKQELTVDGRTVGLSNSDEMTIKSIATRESYLTTTTWNVSDTPDTPLFSCEVSPIQYDRVIPGGGTPTEMHLTPMAFAAVPFAFWRGSMKYRFQIVSSNFHKGRLKVQWDPHGFGNYAYNTQYTHLFDIAEDKDFTIEVGWGHELGMLHCETPEVLTDNFEIRSTEAGTSTLGTFNGVLTLSVLNGLTSPSLSAGDIVSVNVFVSAGDDFEVAAPRQSAMNNLVYKQPAFGAQSGLETPVVQTDEDFTQEPSAPIQKLITTSMGNTLEDDDPSYTVYMGETVTSFRQCLKRYCYNGMLPVHQNTLGFTKWTLKAMPPLTGNATSPIWGTTQNYNKVTLLNYLSPAYAAWRGGIKWKVHYDGAQSDPGGMVYVKRVPARPTALPMGTSFSALSYNSDFETICAQAENMPNSWEGNSPNLVMQNSVAEGEVPYQTNRRFVPARSNNYTIAEAQDCPVEFGYVGRTNNPGSVLHTYSAAGEDFSLFFFQAVPVMWDNRN